MLGPQSEGCFKDRVSKAVSFTRDVKDKPTVNFHFLVIFLAFELEAVGVLAGTHHLRPVERGRIRVARQNLLTRGERRQSCPDTGDGDQRNGSGFVDGALFAVLVRLGVLDIIP